MLLNLFTYIKNSLPVRLQRVVVIEFVRALLQQLNAVSDRFHLLVPGYRYRINANASVISLWHHIRRELDVDVFIAELDGKPIDFLVEVGGFVDENRLRTLIDSYKLAGKSYVFRVGAVEYTASFIGHRCENIGVDYQAKFIEHYCEDDGIVRIDVVVVPQTGNDYEIVLTASRFVRSNTEVAIEIFDPHGTMLFGEFYVTIASGNISASKMVDFSEFALAGALLRTNSKLLSPINGSDEYFNYTVRDVRHRYGQ